MTSKITPEQLDLLIDQKSKQPKKSATSTSTRQKILTFAREKFLRFGFSRVPVQELCSELKISKKTFYNHYKNRDDLVEAIILDNIATFAPHVQRIFSSGKPVPEVLEDYFQFLQVHVLSRVTKVFLEDLQNQMPETWNSLAAFRRGIILQFESLMERGIKEGTVDPDIDPKVYTKILVATVDTVAVGNFLRQNDLTMPEIIKTLKQIFVNGIIQKPSKGAGS